MATESFGPSALATPANAVTVARLVIAPVLFLQILRSGQTWMSFWFWFVLASTDGVDGYLARRQGATRSGAFLDPLADKVLVLGALIVLVADDVFWWLPVAVLAVREVAVSLYRTWVGRHGVSVPARPLAKAKTFVQSVAIGIALMPPLADRMWIPLGLLWLSVALAVVSGGQYLLDGRRAAARAV